MKKIIYALEIDDTFYYEQAFNSLKKDAINDIKNFLDKKNKIEENIKKIGIRTNRDEHEICRLNGKISYIGEKYDIERWDL